MKIILNKYSNKDRRSENMKIFTKRIAHELCRRGFKIIKTEINNEKPWMYVYVFKDSEELKAALTELSNKQK